MYVITKNGKPIDIFNNQADADFYYKTRHQKQIYKIENTLKEVTEERYYYLLESEDPLFIDGFIFANPEPVDKYKSQTKTYHCTKQDLKKARD